MSLLQPRIRNAWHNGAMKDNAYFDNASTTWPKPEAVYLFIDQFQRSHGVNPSRGGYAMAVETEAMVIQTRKLLATFFGFTGSANRVVFTANITDSLNMVLSGLLQSGDHVVITRLEHNAVLRTTQYLSQDNGVEVTQVPIDATGGESATQAQSAAGVVSVDAVRAALKKNTKAIVINHASNVTGRVQPLDEIGQLAKEFSIPLIVDTAQTAGVLPIDMQSQGIAVATFTGHKGLFGPMGIGGFIINEDIDLKVTKFGGNGILSENLYQPEQWPHRHEVGTLPVPAIAGLHAGQRWFNALGESIASAYGITSGKGARTLKVALNSDDLDTPLNAKQHALRVTDAIKHIHRIEMRHLEKLLDVLTRFDHVRVLGGVNTNFENPQVATLSFVSNKVSTARIAESLDADYHVCLRAGLHCAPLVHTDENTIAGGGAVRLAPGLFTDDEDMTQLTDGLLDVLG